MKKSDLLSTIFILTSALALYFQTSMLKQQVLEIQQKILIMQSEIKTQGEKFLIPWDENREKVTEPIVEI